MLFGANPTQYGGCEINALAGIAGRASLLGTGNWNITDGGLLGCAITGSLSYSPSAPTSGNVTATLTLNMTGTVTSTGWTMVDAITYTKVYSVNTTEPVNFTSVYGFTGSAMVVITRIDKDAPYATSVVYNPSSNTNGDVEVTLTINEAVQAISGWVG